MDGHPRQNPAYRPATEKALVTGLFLWTRFAGDSSGSPRDGRDCGLRGTARAVARRGLVDCAGCEPLRTGDGTRTPTPSLPASQRQSFRSSSQTGALTRLRHAPSWLIVATPIPGACLAARLP